MCAHSTQDPCPPSASHAFNIFPSPVSFCPRPARIHTKKGKFLRVIVIITHPLTHTLVLSLILFPVHHLRSHHIDRRPHHIDHRPHHLHHIRLHHIKLVNIRLIPSDSSHPTSSHPTIQSMVIVVAVAVVGREGGRERGGYMLGM